MGVRGGDANRWVRALGVRAPREIWHTNLEAASEAKVATLIADEVVSGGV